MTPQAYQDWLASLKGQKITPQYEINSGGAESAGDSTRAYILDPEGNKFYLDQGATQQAEGQAQASGNYQGSGLLGGYYGSEADGNAGAKGGTYQDFITNSDGTLSTSGDSRQVIGNDESTWGLWRPIVELAATAAGGYAAGTALSGGSVTGYSAGSLQSSLATPTVEGGTTANLVGTGTTDAATTGMTDGAWLGATEDAAAGTAAGGGAAAAPSVASTLPAITSEQVAAGATAASAANSVMNNGSQEPYTDSSAQGQDTTSGTPAGSTGGVGNPDDPSAGGAGAGDTGYTGSDPNSTSFDWNSILKGLGSTGDILAKILKTGVGGSNLGSILGAVLAAREQRATADRMMDMYGRYNGQADYYGTKLKQSYDDPQAWLQGADTQAVMNTTGDYLQRKDAASGGLSNNIGRNVTLNNAMYSNLSDYRKGLSGTYSNLAGISTGQGATQAAQAQGSANTPLYRTLSAIGSNGS